MNRLVDRGAITAAYVGIGMAVTVGISFLLIIPIEPIVWLLSLPSGLLIGYYANQRSARVHGPWGRILANGLFAGLATGLTLALLILAVKALFFFADDGYRDPGLGGRLTCDPGAACVYARYLDVEEGGRIAELEAAGVTDVASFTAFYWAEQFRSAGLVLSLTTLGGVAGAGIFGVTRRERGVEGSATA